MTPSDRNAESQQIRPEWYYLILSVPFGFALLFLTPPSQVPDEFAHLMRSFQLSEGRFVAVKVGSQTGGDLPVSLTTMMSPYWGIPFHPTVKTTVASVRKSADIPLDRDKRHFVNFPNTAMTPPLPYLPQALGIVLASQLTSSVLYLMYAGRAFNLLATISVTFLAIRRTPIGKWMFAVLALTPMSMFIAASLSADALTNALSFLLIAQILHVAFGPQACVTGTSILQMALLGIAIGQCKQAYFLLPACILIIPIVRFGSWRRYCISFAVVMVVTCLSVVAWALVVRGIYSPANPLVEIDPGRQLQLIQTDPSRFLTALKVTIQNTPSYFQQFAGVLGFLDTYLPDWVIYTTWAVILIACLDHLVPPGNVRLLHVSLFLGISLVTSFIVTFIIYLTWEKVGGTTLIGIQGRYFIPLSPLIGLVIARVRELMPNSWLRHLPLLNAISISILPSLLLVTLFTLYARYYE